MGATADWTGRFTSFVRAGKEKGCGVVYTATHFDVPPGIREIGSVLMVDDAVSGGNTACAVLRHLLAAGFSSKADFAVATPLLVRSGV